MRFWSKVQMRRDADGCWLWTGRIGPNGYGSHGSQLAHRVAWQWATGEPPPAGRVLDHLCRVRHCVRPDHLDLVTQKMNCERGDAWHQDDQCKHGHLLTPDNVYLTPSRGRRCRMCHANRERERHRAKRAAAR